MAEAPEKASDPLNVGVADRVERLRADRDLSIRQLAEMVGTSPTRMHHLLRAMQVWSVPYLRTVADALGVGARDLLPGDDLPVVGLVLSPDRRKAMRAIDKAIDVGDMPAALEALADAMRAAKAEKVGK